MSAPKMPSAAPAELPLRGGTEGAAMTLRPLLSAVMRGPAGWFERVDGPLAPLKALGLGVREEQRIDVPIVAFLLEHPSAGLVLIDTGLHGSIAAVRARSARATSERSAARWCAECACAPSRASSRSSPRSGSARRTSD